MTLETLGIEATLSHAQNDQCKDTRIKGMHNTLCKFKIIWEIV